MSLLPAVAAMAAIVLSGWGLAAWACVGSAVSDRRSLVPLIAVLGLGLWSGSYVVVLFSVGPTAAALFAKDLVLAAAGVGLLLTCRRNCRLVPTNTVPPRRTPRLSAIVFALSAAGGVWFFMMTASNEPEGAYDAWARWNLRARFFHRDPQDPARAFAPELLWSLPDYPLMLSGMVAQGWEVVGSELLAVPFVISAVFTLSAVGLLLGTVARLRGPVWGLSAGAVLVGSPQFMLLGAGQIADIRLATYTLAAGCLLATALEMPGAGSWRLVALAGACASMGAWTKNEGALAFAALTATVFIGARGGGFALRLRRITCFLLGAAPFLLLLGYFKRAYAPPSWNATGTDASDVVLRASDPQRYVQIARGFLGEVFDPRDWCGFPLVLPAVVAVLRLRSSGPAFPRAPATACGLIVLGFAVAYLLSPADLDWQIPTSIDRLWAQVWPLVILTAFLALPHRPLFPAASAEPTAGGSDE